MGACGHGLFENDGAMDWLGDLVERSELAQLWAESDGEEWREDVRALQHRLAGRAD